MKIAFLSPEYPHVRIGNSGGIGTSIKNLAESLTDLGHSVHILVYGQSSEDVFEESGITIQLVRNVKIKGLSWFFTRKKLEKIVDDLYRNQKIDIVEVPDWTGISSFINPVKCPIIIKLHGSDTYFCHLDNRPVKWFNRFHEKRALQKADGYISVSQFTAKKTNQLFGLRIPFTIIPNGINSTIFKTIESVDQVPNTILYFGSLIRKKGLLELPLIFNKVIEQNPEAKLVLLGRDSPDIISGGVSTWMMMQSLFTLKAKEQVTYFGGVPYEEVRGHIARASVCVFPSFAEALPVSWLEAMAMEKALVASNIGWGQEVIISGKEGFLVHPKDHQVYADAIVNLLENKALNTKFGKNASAKIKLNFTNDLIAKQNIAYYQSVINNKNVSI